MLNSEDALKYLNGDTSVVKASQPSDTQPTDVPGGNPSPTVTPDTNPNPNEDPQLENSNQDPSSSETGTATQTDDDGKGAQDPNPAPADTEKKQDPKPDFLEGKRDKKLPYQNPSSIDQLKANQAFVRQKRKFQAKVAAQQEEIDKLKAQLAKFNAVDPNSYKDDPDRLMDMKLAKNNIQNAINSLQTDQQRTAQEAEEAEMEQANLIYQARVDACFPDEAEKKHYNTLMANGRDKFIAFLEENDPKHTVLQYLDDCDISPLVTRVLMTNPNALMAVMNRQNPLSRAMELRALEQRIKLEKRLKQTKGNPTPKAPEGGKPHLPTTGLQTKQGASKGTGAPVRDAVYWQNYLATHTH